MGVFVGSPVGGLGGRTMGGVDGSNNGRICGGTRGFLSSMVELLPET